MRKLQDMNKEDQNGHPILLLALCAAGWFSPERAAVLPFPAAATGPFGVSIGVMVVAMHSVVWCAPHDGRELQILPGFPLPAVSPGLLHTGNGAALTLGRKEKAPNPALQPPHPASLARGSPETPLCVSLLML